MTIDSASIAVLDERLRGLQSRQDRFEEQVKRQIELVITESKARDDAISQKVDKIPEATAQLLKTYVTQERFKPVELVAYGLVTCTLATVMIAVLSLIVKKSGT